MSRSRSNRPNLSPAELRKRVNLTQVQLAAAIGRDPSTISDWERGEREPSLTPLETYKLMLALEASIEELVWAYSRVDVDEI